MLSSAPSFVCLVCNLRECVRVCDYYLWLFKTTYFIDVDAIRFFSSVAFSFEQSPKDGERRRGREGLIAIDAGGCGE